MKLAILCEAKDVEASLTEDVSINDVVCAHLVIAMGTMRDGRFGVLVEVWLGHA